MEFISTLLSRFRFSEHKTDPVAVSDIGFVEALVIGREYARKNTPDLTDTHAIAKVIREVDAAVFALTEGRVRARISKHGIELHCSATHRADTVFGMDSFDSFPIRLWSQENVENESELRAEITRTLSDQRTFSRIEHLMSFDPGTDNPFSEGTIVGVMKDLATRGYLGLGPSSTEVNDDLNLVVSEINEGLPLLSAGLVTAELTLDGINFRTSNGRLSFMEIPQPRYSYPIVAGDVIAGDVDALRDVVKRKIAVAWNTPAFQNLVSEARKPSF